MGAVRSLLRRVDAALIAPDPEPAERLLGYGFGGLGAVFGGVAAWTAGLSPLAVIVFVAFGFDLLGGVVVNASPSGSLRFHRPEVPRWNALGFAAGHVHLPVLALILPDMPWLTAVVLYGGTVLATAVVILAPVRLRQPIAFGLAAVLIVAAVSVDRKSVV